MGKRLLLAAACGVALILLGILAERIFFGGQWFFTEPLHTPKAASADAAKHSGASGHSALLINGSGVVEHREPDRTWRQLAVGSGVEISEDVRTGANSSARLQIGSQVTIELAELTEVNVAQLSETLSRIRIQDGRVVSEVQSRPDFVFRVQVQNSTSEAETHAGKFAVLKRGTAPAAFAAERGNLVVTGSGESVTLNPGEQTLVEDGGVPSAPTKLSPSLLLKLGRPPALRQRSHHLEIAGVTSPGAVVTTSGQVLVPSKASGKFTGVVALVDGPNEIRVEVEDVAGRKQSATLPKVIVDANAPRVSGKVLW